MYVRQIAFFCPYKFYKTFVTKPVLSILRKQGHQAMNYLDDFFLVGDNFEECLKTVEDSVDLLSKTRVSSKYRKICFYAYSKN